MSPTNYSRYKYTPDEIEEQAFLARFVVRTDDFAELFEELKSADYSVPNQHTIIIGQRGQGKTTLLRKIMLEVQNDPQLSRFLLPVKFSEEQYQIRSLCRLWEEVADYLQTLYEDEFADILDKMEAHFDDDDYDLQCFSYLETVVKSKNKKLLLLIDNIDELLGKLKEKEQRRLREILLTSSTFIIIGGSTKMIEQQYDYGKPFYEFFKIIKLTGLNKEDSIAFLRTIGDAQQNKKIAAIIKNAPERIETLRRLTGGVPRTLMMLFDIFIDDSDNAFDDLIKVLDDATPLYKHRMDDLPDTLQEITHTIAMNWDGMLTKDIAKKTRLESKVVSAQLKQLETKYGIVESISIGKNKIYKIEERFFNIWYLMRFGRKKDRQKIEWLVKFLVSWCSSEELEERAGRFMNAVKKGEIKESYAYHMCEALSYAGLREATEHNMKQRVKDYLKDIDSNLVGEISDSDRDIRNKVIELCEDNNIDEAIKLLIKSQKNSSAILFMFGYLYEEQKEYSKAEGYYLQALESGNNDALNNLGLLYIEKKEYSKAEKYYLKAIESSNNNALNSLSWLYFKQALNINKAIMLVSKSYKEDRNYDNIHSFATILLWSEDFSKSYGKFLEWLEYDHALDDKVGVTLYLNLLMAKGQLYKAKEFFEMPEYDLKNRYKPLWYALMSLMQDEFPHEIKKMGSELKESVDEILMEVEDLREKYAI
ncbi:MAG: hypothetical protein methR_P0186 [Methyloprofundus sp.]|nr:MAG: hypothetical protein methR_P0186 [Methyloprofundus sp.]